MDLRLTFNKVPEEYDRLRPKYPDTLSSGSGTLNAKDYATLCGTANDHRAIPETDRVIFLKKLEDAVNRCVGSYTFSDTFLLCMGIKP